MICKTYRRADFCPKLPKTESDITLTAYARPATHAKADNGQRWAVLVLPGGGYQMLAPSEGEPVALAFLAKGVQAFVLKYSISPAFYPPERCEIRCLSRPYRRMRLFRRRPSCRMSVHPLPSAGHW